MPLDSPTRSATNRHVPALFRLRRCSRFAGLMATLLLTYSVSGCLSNQYVIPKPELERLAQLPPQTRGERVQLVQKIGDRRAPPIPPGGPPPWQGGPPPSHYPGEVGYHDHSHVVVHTGVGFAVPGPGYGGGRHYAGPPPRATHVAPPAGAASAAPAAPGGAAAPVGPGGSAMAQGGAAAGSNMGAQTASSAGRGGLGGQGPSSAKAEEMAVWAVIAVVAASLAVFGLAFTEGSRFDGYTQMAPGQLIYLKNAAGEQKPVPLGSLTPEDASIATEALVMDDEGYGLRLLERRPLDRQGFAFKLDVGGLGTESLGYGVGGFNGNIQLGYFPQQWLGILGTAALAWGDVPGTGTFSRHRALLEAQLMPVRLGIFNMGVFGHGGMQWSADPGDASARSGPALGGGLLLEFELTTRLALTLRGGWTTARVQDDPTWRGMGYITAGLAVY
jgi:hypothetical protein